MYVYILLYYIYYIYTHKWGLTKESKGILKYYEVKIIVIYIYIYIYIYMPYVLIVLNKLWEIYKGPIRSAVTGERKRE